MLKTKYRLNRFRTGINNILNKIELTPALSRSFRISIYVVCIALIILIGYKNVAETRHLKQVRSEIKLQNIILVQENERLAREINHLQDRKECLEELARKKMDMAKEGEVIFKFK